MSPPGKNRLVQALTKDLLVDLEDRLRAEALKAFEIIRDNTGLNKKRARESEGQLRFRMMEQRFEEVCQDHGGKLLEGGVIPGSNYKVYQPFMRFEVEGAGFIFGLATMSEPNTLPNKNRSRRAGVRLNYFLTPRLIFDETSPQVGDIFLLLLVSRHREKAGQIEEIAIGIVDTEYENFLFYEPMEKFLSGHADVSLSVSAGELEPVPQEPTVVLKKNPTPFVPPESPAAEQMKGLEQPDLPAAG